jgi:hypothetical protein
MAGSPFRGASTTNRWPALSNWIPRGLAKPVATRPIWYPEATTAGYDGVREVEQVVCADATNRSAASAASNAEAYIVKTNVGV